MAIQEVESIPEHYKNVLITDDDLLINIIDELRSCVNACLPSCN